MIVFLRGEIVEKTQTSIYLDVNGVGYEVSMAAKALSALPHVGQTTVVYTYMQLREDGVSLFGFVSLEEKALFERLIGVNGVGPKVALAALSSYTPQTLVEIIAAQDVSAMQRIPGVGKKTASRIILELKGSFDQGFENLFAKAEDGAKTSSALDTAREALLSMGFSSTESELALKDAPSDATEGVLLQYALKRLGE